MSARGRVLTVASILFGCGPNVTAIDDSASTGLASSGSTSTGSGGASSSNTPTSTTIDVAETSTGPAPSTDDSTSTTGGPTSGSSSTSGSTGASSESSGTTGLLDCPGQPDDGAPAGMACVANDDCASGLCLIFQDTPTDDDAVCGQPVPECGTRFTGTVRDLTTQASSSTEVAVLTLLDALVDPTGATPVVSATSDEDGTYDLASDAPIASAIGVMGRVGGGGSYATSGAVLALDEGGYAPGPAVHELWLVPEASLAEWSAAMADVPPEHLPLGEAGGVVGFVRDTAGAPVAGATVAPESESSDAIVRYPQADGSVLATQTDATGLFVIVGGATTGETYVATAGGLSASGMATNVPQLVFTLPLTLE